MPFGKRVNKWTYSLSAMQNYKKMIRALMYLLEIC